MRGIILSILIFLLIGNNVLLAQNHQEKDTVVYVKYTLSEVGFSVKIPNFFEANTSENIYTRKQKGSVFKYAYIKNVQPRMFCDSLTPEYFAAQNLTNMTTSVNEKYSVYTGNFTVGQVLFNRTFYVTTYKSGTVLGIFQYPAAYKELVEQFIYKSFNTCKHE